VVLAASAAGAVQTSSSNTTTPASGSFPVELGRRSHSATGTCTDTRDRNFVPRAFTPVLANHTKHLSLLDILAVGVDRMQRNFEPMRKQVQARKGTFLSDATAKLVI